MNQKKDQQVIDKQIINSQKKPSEFSDGFSKIFTKHSIAISYTYSPALLIFENLAL